MSAGPAAIVPARAGLLCWAAVCGGATVLAFAWFAAWIAGGILPRTIDGAPGPRWETGPALLWNASLFVGYCGLHSLLARSWCKRVTRRFVPASVERVTYCGLFSVLIIAFCWVWAPMPAPVWRVESAVGVAALWTLFGLAWAGHLWSIWYIDLAEFFGLRQVGFALRGEAYRPPPEADRRTYLIGHVPLVVTLAIIPWAAPSMSQGHLLLAVIGTLYCGLGAWWADRDVSLPH